MLKSRDTKKLLIRAMSMVLIVGAFIFGAKFMETDKNTKGKLREVPPREATEEQVSGNSVMKLPQEPEISAQTAIVMDLNSGMVLYEKKSQEKVYPASTTKILTALLAIEQGDLNDAVTISKTASGVEGSSIYLEVGEKISLKDLVYGLMLRSGNDAAIAISEKISGSAAAFVEEMNERAREIGAEHTHFMNPNGLYDDEHYTTAYDMALIARQAMLNPAFKEVAASKSWTAERGEGKFNVFYNKNKVVQEYEGGTGVKIGYTKSSGRTLVASSKRGEMELICVVMNDPNWFEDSYQLMDAVYDSYEQVTIAQKQQRLKTIPVEGGVKEYAYVGTKEPVLCPVLKENEEAEVSIQYVLGFQCQAPVRRWQEAGMLNVYVNGAYVHSVPLYFLEDIDAL
ncbi:D-alanyl-D-alanine carboxypeptidase family protein [Sinanaerobacter sp. ZZT-01]|uniref:D-alanyl-D-alanine carboxypeptidase family protein n=1 Tax=Sinanaerobacter sp. ZZT-01 TaxID=3111540 RepID=UPI002D7755CD|nr:D-alanyl-D-alanine carboxypeptidase family protein [Sinanaerobacter sp. ZZT-01]WRR94550.1 D-alanyl-D-alanine carboxypeptidase family protein [Sinanaerobacter sp. ZZT-01]